MEKRVNYISQLHITVAVYKAMILMKQKGL